LRLDDHANVLIRRLLRCGSADDSGFGGSGTRIGRNFLRWLITAHQQQGRHQHQCTAKCLAQWLLSHHTA
jgi:hypothetical protein